MKKLFLPLIMGGCMLSFVACDSGTSTETTTDSTTNSEVVGATDESSSISTPAIDLNASYMDLSTGKTFTIDRDEPTSSYVNKDTRQPVLYYVNVATNDTFDRSGRLINGALLKMPNGNYSVDESRLKTKIDEDGDAKIKGEDMKFKADGNEEEAKIKTNDTKEKIDGNKYKKKTDTSKIVIRQ